MGWGLHSRFCVQPNNCVEVVLLCVVVGVVTIFDSIMGFNIGLNIAFNIGLDIGLNIESILGSIQGAQKKMSNMGHQISRH